MRAGRALHWLWRAAALVLIAALLYALAWQSVREGIDAQADAKAAVFAAGKTPWDFHPRAADDLIAGHAFGAASVAAVDGGLRIGSEAGTPYTLGVRLPYPAPTTTFPVLNLALQVTAPTRLRWRVRTKLAGPLLESAPLMIQPGTSDLRADLRQLQWRDAATGHAAPPPSRVAMLRLELQHAADTNITLRALTWQHAVDGAPWAPPVAVLPGGSTEHLLRERDRERAEAPAALIRATPTTGPPRSAAAHNRVQTVLVLLAFALYVVLTWQQTRRGHSDLAPRILPLFQMAICAGPPLVWAIGMYGDPDPGPAWLAALATSWLFTLWLAWRDYGQTWRWLTWQGRREGRDWAMAGVTTGLVTVLLLAWQAAPHALPAARIVTYGAWAALQQLLMLAVLAPRLRGLLPGRWWAALAVAALFALAHAPNALLMQLALVGEVLWAWWFLRRPVLAPAVLAHAVAGILLAAAMSGLPLRSLEVGARFLM